MTNWDVTQWDKDVYAVRGHVSNAQFIDAVLSYFGTEDGSGYAYDGIHQTYARFIPSFETDEYGCYIECGQGKGAFAITIGTLKEF